MRNLRNFLCASLMLLAGHSSAQEVNSYSYDVFGRLVSSSRTVNSSVSSGSSIAYDKADNRTCLATSTGSTNTACLASAAWTASLTTGTISSPYVTIVGYSSSSSIGSLSPTNYSGFTITELTSNNGYSLILTMSSSSPPPNSGWNSITVPGEGTLARTAASYSVSGNTASWTWINSGHTVSSGQVTIQ